MNYILQLYISVKNVVTKVLKILYLLVKVTVPPEGFEEFAPYAWVVMELNDDSRLRISGFLGNIATPEDLPISTPVEIIGFDQRGIIIKKQ